MFDVNQEWEEIGKNMHDLMKKLFPICRSITGNGVRQTLLIIKEKIPLEIIEVPSGTKVFDWTVPKEWNIKDAYIKNSEGKKIINFKKSNLHVVNYSIPFKKKLPLEKLKKNLFSLPKYPEWIPYLTTYYEENWGFCLTHNQLDELEEGMYEILIDSTLEEGHLTYGELYLRGETEKEVLFSCYICHPSLCNDNLSGPVLLISLASYLIRLKKNTSLKYSYRFLFIPETIGAINWLCNNENNVKNIFSGLIATCVGDPGNTTYKKTREGNTITDKVIEKVLIDSGEPFKIIEFFPSGSDERQFCSPGFNLSIGSLMRTMYGHFPEYHTSADNLDFVKPRFLADSLKKYMKYIYILENNRTYINLNPKCEPQLGGRGLYRMFRGQKGGEIDELAVFWILNLSDGKNSLLDISIRSNMSFELIKKASDILVKKELLQEIFTNNKDNI